MRTLVRNRRADRLTAALALLLVACLAGGLPAAAFSSAWTTPKRVFAHDSAPLHSMTTFNGAVHIATERGSTGIWYVTNSGGSWTECQVSDGDDRHPSIAVSGGVVHVAFARRDPGTQGILTASSDQAAPTAGCGWAVTRRHDSPASHPSMAAYGDTLHIAFRIGSKKLKYMRGAAADGDWSLLETIDGTCCTSAPSLDVTTGGSPRVAYGDGTKRSDGLKYAMRTGDGWKKRKASGGRVMHVTMVLDKSPGVFNPPPNSPRIIYVVRKQGTYFASKATTNVKGPWSLGFYGRHFGAPDIIHSANNTLLLYGGRGKLFTSIFRGGIRFEEKLSGSGRDVKPQLDGNMVTFARNKGTKGVYFSRPK